VARMGRTLDLKAPLRNRSPLMQGQMPAKITYATEQNQEGRPKLL